MSPWRTTLRKWDRRVAVLLGLLAIILLLPVGEERQEVPPVAVPSAADSVTIVAGARYEEGPLHRFLLGKGYRELWVEPIVVPVLDLEEFAGGLTPMRTGGGMQTRSLRFLSADSVEYVFRSIDKNPTLMIKPPFRRSLYAHVVQDQTASAHPGGPLIVPGLLDAVGVLHAEPYLAVLPDDPRLGAYREEFGGMLGILEESPNERPGPRPGFAGATHIEDTDVMLGKLSSASLQQVDARAFLVARLIDLVVNDWDRHEDQWRWAGWYRDSETPMVWKPIPRDRDQAFASYGGVFPSLARLIAPRQVSFGPEYTGLNGLAHNSRNIDRTILAPLPEPAWDSAVTFVQSRLTDSVIDTAVRRMPDPWWRISGPELSATLKARRELLPKVAAQLRRRLVT